MENFKLKTKEILKFVANHEKAQKVLLLLKDELSSNSNPNFLPKLPLNYNQNISLRWLPPASIAVVGSLMLGSIIRNTTQNIDLAIQIPSELLSEKDHLNFRYAYKRAHYLAMAAAIISNSSFGNSLLLEWSPLDNDPRHAILLISSNPNFPETHFSKHGLKIRLFCSIAPDVFPVHRLAPLRNNVRKSSESSSTQKTPQPPTPRYNSLILRDMHLVSHLNTLHPVFSTLPAFKEALILLKIWLLKRTATSSVAFMSPFILAMVIAYLHRIKKLAKGFSSYQIIKVTLSFLANLNLSEPLFLGNIQDSSIDSESPFSADAFKSAFPVCIIDPSGLLNLTSNATLQSAKLFQHEAKLALSLLSQTDIDNFENLFLKPANEPLLKFDNIFRIPRISAISSLWGLDDSLDNYSFTPHLLQKISSLFELALNKRVKAVFVSAKQIPNWSLDSDPPSISSSKNSQSQLENEEALDICLAFILDPEYSLLPIEQGPLGDQIEASREFKQIWGSKVELRRFEDGSISNTVSFQSDSSLESRQMLVARMTAFLLEKHFGVDLHRRESVIYWSGLGNRFLKPPGQIIATNSFQTVMDAFISLTKALKSLKELPLQIQSLVPVSESLRYSSVFIPQPIQNVQQPISQSPHELLIQFESSGKWPEELKAIQNMKLAFYIRIAELVNQTKKSFAEVSLGEDSNDSGFLDITHESFLFRIRIHHDREQVLLQDLVRKSTTAFQSLGSQMMTANLETSKDLLNRYVQTYQRIPWHAHHMGNLCLRFEFLGTTMRLVKRWLAAHMLLSRCGSCGIPEQVVELLCAYVYTNPGPYSTPSSGFTGFMRVLSLFATFDWQYDSLIVECEQNALTMDIRQTINETFSKMQKQGTGHIPMFVATERDTDSSWWGLSNLHPKILDRLKQLSNACLDHLNTRLSSCQDHQIAPIFLPDLKSFHSIISLDSKKLPTYLQNIQFNPNLAPSYTSKFRNLPSESDKTLNDLCKFSITEKYISELVEHFGNVCMFFYDWYGGESIGIVWKHPMALSNSNQGEKLRINLAYNMQYLKDDFVTFNTHATLAEMQLLGEGLVTNVSVV